jgi:shikimate kinase
MPGSGKSTCAKILSTTLGVNSFDLDNLITGYAGISIPEIFDRFGERRFRDLESRMLKSFDIENAVLATGGGTPCYFDNLKFMTSKGTVIFIDPPFNILKFRLLRSNSGRPLMKDKKQGAAIRKLYGQRLPFYSRAHFRAINCYEVVRFCEREFNLNSTIVV